MTMNANDALRKQPTTPARPITAVNREWLVTMQNSLKPIVGKSAWEAFLEDLKPDLRSFFLAESGHDSWVEVEALVEILSSLNLHFGEITPHVRGALVGEEIARAALWIQGEGRDLSASFATLVDCLKGFVQGGIEMWREDREDGSADLLLFGTIAIPGFFANYATALVQAYLDHVTKGRYHVEYLEDFQNIKDLHAYRAKSIA